MRSKFSINDVAEKYVYDELYDSTLTVAQQFPEKNKFRLKGSYQSSLVRNLPWSNAGRRRISSCNSRRGEVREEQTILLTMEWEKYPSSTRVF